MDRCQALRTGCIAELKIRPDIPANQVGLAMPYYLGFSLQVRQLCW